MIFLSKFRFGFSGLLVLILSSCSSLQEVPNALNMPLAGYKGDTKASLNIGTGGLALQASYAVDSHLVLTSSTKYNFFPQNGADNDGGPITIFHNEWQEDIGAGYFFEPFDNSRFEIIGGLGWSSMNYSSSYENIDLAGDSYYNTYFNGNIVHGFIQADGGIVNRGFSLGLGMRLSDRYYIGNYESYQNINSGFDHQLTDDKYKLQVNTFCIEPGIVTSFGTGDMKFNIMLGFSFNTTGFILDPVIAQNKASWLPSLPIFLSTGVTYAIHGK